MRWLIIIIMFIPAVLAFEIDSSTYEADSFHFGLTGSTADNAIYSTRSTTTYQQPGTYLADSGSYQMNVGIYETGVEDVESPSVTLISPNDTIYTNTAQVTFSVLVSDNIDLANVSLYGSWGGGWHINETNISGLNPATYSFYITIPEGYWIWNIEACDGSGNCAFATANRTINMDLSNPAVTLLSPENNDTWTTSSTVQFQYNTTDNMGIAYAELYIDDIFVLNDSSVTNGTNSFSRPLNNGNYNWSIKVVDLAGNYYITPVYNLTVAMAAPTGSGGGTGFDGPISREFAEGVLDEEGGISKGARDLIIWLLSIYFFWLLFLYDEGDKKEKIRTGLFLLKNKKK